MPEHKLSPLALSLCSILKLRPVGFDFETAERFPLVDGGSLTIGAAALLAAVLILPIQESLAANVLICLKAPALRP